MNPPRARRLGVSSFQEENSAVGGKAAFLAHSSPAYGDAGYSELRNKENMEDVPSQSISGVPPIIAAPEEVVKKAVLRGRTIGLLKLVGSAAGLLLAIWLLFAFVIPFIEPVSRPSEVKISNITDGQATVFWTTPKATRDMVVLSEDTNFPIFPMFAKKKYVDDGDKGLKNPKFYTTHHVTAGDLKPVTKYYFKVYQGVQEVYSGEFTTGPTLALPPTPNPVYGRVVKADKTPVAGAIVYLQVRVRDRVRESSVLSTLTNSSGGWSIELANLRTADLQKNYEMTQGEALEIMVEGGARGKGNIQVSDINKVPLPDIVIKQ